MLNKKKAEIMPERKKKGYMTDARSHPWLLKMQEFEPQTLASRLQPTR